MKVMSLRVALIVTVFFFFSQPVHVSAQPEQPELQGEPLTITEYFDNIVKHHPVVRQARFLSDLAKQELRLARGAFDPKLKSDYNVKEFGDKVYYNTWDSKLDVPVWFNTDLNIGYERNDGEFLNEQLSNTEDGLIYAGVSLPVGRGLFIDERRAAVRQARLMQDMAEAEKIREINKVLLNAAKAYWNWYNAYQDYAIINEVEELARVRYNGVVQQVINGDLAPFDSLKAFINYQQRDVQREQAELDYTNAGIVLSNFLWLSEDDDALVPLELSRTTYPVLLSPIDAEELISLQTLQTLQDSARMNHPKLVELNAKIQQLEIEQRLNREFLKPEVNLKYNFLTKSIAEAGGGAGGNGANGGEGFFMNDYKFGAELYFPLFLRKERAKLQMTNIKLEQNFFDRQNQSRNIENEINTAYNSMLNLAEIISMQARMVENYESLLAGEVIKFENGESSIFLINTRETELLDARLKLVSLQTKYEKAKLELLYAAGVPYLQN